MGQRLRFPRNNGPPLPSLKPAISHLSPVLAPSPVISHLSPPPGRQMLTPRPSMSITAIDSGGSTWDILRSFAPDEEHNDLGAEGRRRKSFNLEEDEEEEAAPAGGEVEGEELRLGKTSEDFTGTSSCSNLNDDDTSSTTTKRRIRSWMRGVLFGVKKKGMTAIE